MVTELFVPRPKIIVPKPKSYIKLDMAFGVGAGTTLFDKSRYRSHGAISGASFAAGLHGKCLDFDPTVPSYVEIPATATQLDFTSEDFSFVVRCKANSFVGNITLIERGAIAGAGYIWLIYSNDLIVFYTAPDWSGTFASGPGLATDTWYTIGFSRDGETGWIYLNGVDVTTPSGAHTNLGSSSSAATIGIYNDKVTSPWDGKMEFFRAFGGIALSASEHLAYHNALK